MKHIFASNKEMKNIMECETLKEIHLKQGADWLTVVLNIES